MTLSDKTDKRVNIYTSNEISMTTHLNDQKDPQNVDKKYDLADTEEH